MSKRYTTKEAQVIAGLNRKDLFNFKNVIRAEHGKTTGQKNKNGDDYAGYKEYDDKSMDRLVIVGFLKKLGVENKEIKKILSDEEFDDIKILDQIIENANNKIKNLQDIITVADDIRYSGFSFFKINLLKTKNIGEMANYIKTIKERDNIKKVAETNLTDGQYEKLMNIMKKFIKLLNHEVTSITVQKHTRELVDSMKDVLNADDSYITMLAMSYRGTGSIAKNIDNKTKKGVANFIGESIIYYYNNICYKETMYELHHIDYEKLKSNNITEEDDIEIYIYQIMIKILKKYFGDYLPNSELLEIGKMYTSREDIEDGTFDKLFLKAIETYDERRPAMKSQDNFD